MNVEADSDSRRYKKTHNLQKPRTSKMSERSKTSRATFITKPPSLYTLLFSKYLHTSIIHKKPQPTTPLQPSPPSLDIYIYTNQAMSPRPLHDSAPTPINPKLSNYERFKTSTKYLLANAMFSTRSDIDVF